MGQMIVGAGFVVAAGAMLSPQNPECRCRKLVCSLSVFRKFIYKGVYVGFVKN
jgi:hypothetical protein